MGKLNFPMNTIRGNNNYNSALYKIQQHSPFLKSHFAENTRKREIEDIFTVMKGNFLNSNDIKDYGGLVGPDIPDHKNNCKTWNCRHMIIPEINVPTMNIMLNDPEYLNDTNYIDIIHAEFFNEIASRIITGKNIFSDIDYDGTCFYNSARIPIALLINDMNKFPTGVTSRFTMEFAHSLRGQIHDDIYELFKRNTMAHLHGTSNYKVIEGHYINYTGLHSMATAILLVEKKSSIAGISYPMPELNYYNYFQKNKITYQNLISMIEANSNYL
jgi:hypothetical protein